MHPLDALRVVVHRGGPPRREGEYVLYWCQINKRAEWNRALDYAIARADALSLPLVVYEGLRRDYPHASWRHHRFILDGVRSMGERLAARGIAHHFYLQRSDDGPRPLVQVLSTRAALVVTDDYPAFLVPRQTRRAAAQLSCPLHAVDAAGVAPLRAFPTREVGARTLRPKIMALLPELLAQEDRRARPARDSLSLRLPVDVPRATAMPDDPDELDALVRGCAVDLSVCPAPGARGGREAGLHRLGRFLHERLDRYAAERNRADLDGTSHLSPYLHYGMLSALEIARAATFASPAGHADENVAAFLEELIVRRELSLNFCLHTPEHESLAALPPWAQKNLREHASDPRRETYDRAQLDAARTRDPLWNAVQEQLVRTGEPHGYLRMLWGKRIIEWAPRYDEALAWMIHLNDRYAYDGRDASSYANFLWCFGLHDRPFPPRPIFGVMRPMTSASMGRKAGARGYLARMREGAGAPG